MAYMSQEMKKELSPNIRKVLRKYGMKGTIAVRNYSTLVVNVKGGKLDILGAADIDRDHLQVNHFYIKDHFSDDTVVNFLTELRDAMNGAGSSVKNHDNSDPMTDYFDVGWYISINIGKWDRPYVLEK